MRAAVKPTEGAATGTVLILPMERVRPSAHPGPRPEVLDAQAQRLLAEDLHRLVAIEERGQALPTIAALVMNETGMDASAAMALAERLAAYVLHGELC